MKLGLQKSKITKWSNTYKSYASIYKVEILIFFNLEAQLQDTESVIRSKLIDLMTELKGFNLISLISSDLILVLCYDWFGEESQL